MENWKNVVALRGSAPEKASFFWRSSGYWAPAASTSSLQCVDANQKLGHFNVSRERRATIGLRELRPSSQVIDWCWNFPTDWIFFMFQYRYSLVSLDSIVRTICMSRHKIGLSLLSERIEITILTRNDFKIRVLCQLEDLHYCKCSKIYKIFTLEC